MSRKRKIVLDELRKKQNARKNGFGGRLYFVRKFKDNLIDRFPELIVDSGFQQIMLSLEKWALERDSGDELPF